MRDVEHRLRRLAQPLLQPALAGHVEEVVRLVEQQHLVRRRAAAAPARTASAGRRRGSATGRSRTSSQGRPSTAIATVSKSTSASYPPASPQAASALAYAQLGLARAVPLAARLGRLHGRLGLGSRAAGRPQRAAGPATAPGRPGSTSSPIMPMNWRITPSPPERAIAPACTGRSPATIRSSVVLPAPFGPTSATLAPSPTRNDTSANSSRPSAQDVPDPCHVHVSHGRNSAGQSAAVASSGFPDADPQHPEALLAGVPLDLPALLGAASAAASRRRGAWRRPARRCRPGPAGAASAAAARAAPPCRSGSAGSTRSASNRTSSGTSSGARHATRSASPSAAALAAASSRARCVDVDRVDGRVRGARSASTQRDRPVPAAEVEQVAVVPARAASALRSSTAVPGSSRLGGEHPARRGQAELPVGDGELDLVRAACAAGRLGGEVVLAGHDAPPSTDDATHCPRAGERPCFARPLVRIARNIADTPPPRTVGYPVRHDFWERAAPEAALRLVPAGRGGRGRQLVGRASRQRTGPVLGAAAAVVRRARLRRRSPWRAPWSFAA